MLVDLFVKDVDDVIDDTTDYEAVPAVEVQQATGHSLQALEVLSSRDFTWLISGTV